MVDMAEVGRSFCCISPSDTTLTFGLDGATRVDQPRVLWPECSDELPKEVEVDFGSIAEENLLSRLAGFLWKS